MKKSFLRAFVMMGFVMLAVASTHAQSNPTIEINIPFNFNAGQTQLAAGAYTIEQVSQNVLKIRSEDGRTTVSVLAPQLVGSKSNMSERLVFRRYQDAYFLTQAWVSRTAGGRELYMSAAERRLIKEIKAAGNKAKHTTVNVIAQKQ